MTNLPAYLQGRQPSTSSMAATLVGNLGSGSPPYISIRNNKFTAVDSTGAEKPVGGYSQQPDAVGAVGLYVDVVLIDNNEHTSKVWFEKPFSDNQDGWLPPDCWSDNGIGPSRQASKPQALLCGSCEKNIWGSKVSAVSGKGVKACNDVQKMAGIIPGDDIIYQLRVPPNSRTALRDYVLKFTGQPFDVRDVVTRIWFDQQTIGTLKFVGLGWLDDPTVAQRDKALAEKKTDALVGRGDLPIQGFAQAMQLARPGTTDQQTALVEKHVLPVPAAIRAEVQEQRPFGSVPPHGNVATGASGNPASSPTAQAEPQRRRRRTRAEIESAQPAGQAPVQQAQPQQTAQPQPNPSVAPGPFATAPATMQNAAPNPSAQPNNFGMQPGVPANPEIEAALKDIFGP